MRADSTHVWCDIDIDIDLDRHSHIWEDISELLTEGSMIVFTAVVAGAVSLYLALDCLYPPQAKSEVNEALRDYINWRADSTGRTSAERADDLWYDLCAAAPPRYLQHEGPGRDGHPYPVLLDDEEYTREPWTAAQLVKKLRLPHSPAKQPQRPLASPGRSSREHHCH